MELNRARATTTLAGIMIGAFLLELVNCAGPGDESRALVEMGAIVPGTFKNFELWRLLASIFLHAGIFHLLFNLWAFVQLGYGWELLFGAKRFLVAFFGTGIIASMVSALFIKPPGAVGASGAIFGLLSALIVLMLRTPQWRTAAWVRRLAWQLSVWGFITITLGFFSPHIDNAAHVGGIIGGVLMGLLLAHRRVVTRPD